MTSNLDPGLGEPFTEVSLSMNIVTLPVASVTVSVMLAVLAVLGQLPALRWTPLMRMSRPSLGSVAGEPGTNDEAALAQVRTSGSGTKSAGPRVEKPIRAAAESTSATPFQLLR